MAINPAHLSPVYITIIVIRGGLVWFHRQQTFMFSGPILESHFTTQALYY